MTDKSDTQTNPKTQPLYFMTWDEVEEGEEVWCFNKSNKNEIAQSGVKKNDGLFNKETGDGVLWSKDWVFIPVPQDRPKPNIWDEYLKIGEAELGSYISIQVGGNREGKYRHESCVHEYNIIEFKDNYRALVAWVNHVLDGE